MSRSLQEPRWTGSPGRGPDALSATVCLVSPGHVATNPRLVKEADALCAAGFRVRVVAADYWPAFRPLDDAVLAGAPWEFRKVPLGEGLGRRLRALRRRVCSWLVWRASIPSLRGALWAESDLVGRLAREHAQLTRRNLEIALADLEFLSSLPGGSLIKRP